MKGKNKSGGGKFNQIQNDIIDYLEFNGVSYQYQLAQALGYSYGRIKAAINTLSNDTDWRTAVIELTEPVLCSNGKTKRYISLKNWHRLGEDIFD